MQRQIDGLLLQRDQFIEAIARIDDQGPQRTVELARILSASLEADAMPSLLDQIRMYQDAILEVEAAEASSAMWATIVNRLADRTARFGELEAALTDLERDLDIKTTLYEDMLKRRDTAALTVALTRFERDDLVRFIDDPRRPKKPTSPPWPWFLLAGCLGSLVLGLGLAYASEVTDPYLRNRDSIEQLLGLPMVARMPLLQAVSKGPQAVPASIADALGRRLEVGGRWLWAWLRQAALRVRRPGDRATPSTPENAIDEP